jgi:hypothetical protein
MANRFFSKAQYSLDKDIVHIFGKVAIGATGAPTMSAINSKGVASVVRASAGRYTITLQDKYNRFLDFSMIQVNATASGAPDFYVASVDVVGAKTLVVQCAAADGTTATDPASGVTIYFHVTVANSSAV